MKDKDSYFRGACNSCECQEYANDGGIRCADCRCPASRHKLTYWTKPMMTSTASTKKKNGSLQFLNPLNWIPFQWLYIFNPFAWVTISWLSIWWIRIPMIGLKYNKKPEKTKNIVFEQLEKIQIFATLLVENWPKAWDDFRQSIPDVTKAPNIDLKLNLIQNFQSKLALGLASIGALVIMGILGFRGSHLNFESISGLYAYLTNESIRKRTLAIVLFGTNSFSALIYALLYLGITPKLYGPLGAPIQAVRFIDWNVSFPSLLEISSLLATGQNLDGKLSSKVQIFILSLLISSGQLTPACEILGGFGIFIIGTILVDLGNQFLPILESGEGDHQLAISILQKIISWTFSLIVTTWILGLFTIFQFPETELFYSISDACLKCGVTAMTLYQDTVLKTVRAVYE